MSDNDTLDLEARLGRIEAALASGLGVNLDHFDDRQIIAARQARIDAAADEAAALVKQAFVEDELTIDQRVARIEQALASRGSLS